MTEPAQIRMVTESKSGISKDVKYLGVSHKGDATLRKARESGEVLHKVFLALAS